MKVFIVHAHAGTGSFNGALFQAAAEMDALLPAVRERACKEEI